MKRLLLAAAAVAMLAAPAFGADLRMPVKAPPPIAAPVATWAGFYIGINGGGGVADGRTEADPAGCFLTGACGGSAAFNPLRTVILTDHRGFFTAGGQAGYNWQYGPWVLGLETDLNYNSWKNTTTGAFALAAPLAGTLSSTITDKLTWFGTFRGRVGFTVTPTWLLYATGGLAYGHVASSTTVAFSLAPGDTYAGAASSTRAGWTVGGGTEWMFAPNWSLKAEYLFVDLGHLHYADACVAGAGGFCTAFAPPPAYATSARFRENIGRIGINYHFPVIQ